jgi:hypothetical protein
MRVFLSGDYEFLSQAYGISGTSGMFRNLATRAVYIFHQQHITAASIAPT